MIEMNMTMVLFTSRICEIQRMCTMMTKQVYVANPIPYWSNVKPSAFTLYRIVLIVITKHEQLAQ